MKAVEQDVLAQEVEVKVIPPPAFHYDFRRSLVRVS